MSLIVVTNTELGWDCVVGVYENATDEDLKYMFPGSEYVFHHETISQVEKPPVVDQSTIREVTEPKDRDRTIECVIDNLVIDSDNQKILSSKVGSQINTADCHILANIFLEWLKENNHPNYGGEVVVVKCEKYSYVGMKFPSEKEINVFYDTVKWREDFCDDYLENKKGLILH